MTDDPLRALSRLDAAFAAGGAAVSGVQKAGEHLLGESSKLVPIEEGTLSRSGKVSVGTVDGRITAAVSYDTPYAVPVHEKLDARHDPGRTAKYLETPFLAEADAMRRIIADEVRQAIAAALR